MVSREVDFRAVLMPVEIKVLVFVKLLSADRTVLENVTLVFETATKLLVLGSKMAEEREIDLLLGEMNEEALVTLLLKLGTTDEEFATNAVDEAVRVETTITCVVFEEKLLRGETDEFPSRVTALVRAEDLSCVLERAVEFTRTSELAETVTNVVFGNLVKLRLNTELVTTLENCKVLTDEPELDRNVVLVLFGVDEMFTLDVSTPPEELTTTVRLVVKVLGNVRVPLFLVGKNTDVAKVTKVDLSLIDVEFSTAVLLAVEGNYERETWIRQQNTIFENFRPQSMQFTFTRR